MNTRKLFLKTYRILNLLLIFIMSFGSPLGTLAQVWTDPVDYPPGSEVWIQGDNSNGAAYQLGEVVRVDVVGPLGADGIPYQAACEDVVEEPDPENRPGYYYWTCQVMLWDSVYAVGEYVYTATGLSSGEIETGIFTDGPANYISLDFVASAPLSYDHATGGGAFDDRTVGKSADIVESLEGGDFKCGDVATFLLEIDLDGTQKSPEMPRTARFLIDFTLDTTGQTGLALGPVSYVGINYTPVQDLIPGEDGVDQGMVDDGGSTATLISQTAPTVTEPPYFTPGQVNRVEIQVTDLEYSENVILRVDAKIACKFGSSPTGNLQAAIYSGTVIRIGDSIVAAENIPVGQQTVPFKASEDVIFPGVIIVDKVTDPSVAPDLFDFKVSAPGGPLSMPYLQTFQLADQTPPWNSGNIDPSYAAIGNTITLVEGSYTVEEISPLPNGWEFTNGTCVNQFNEIQGTVGQSVTFDLNENEVVTCTFYNTRNYNQDLTVTKTATAAKQRTYNWLIDKSVDDTLIEIAEGGKATFNYTVDVTPNGFTDSVWVVTGKITVNNPNSFDVAGVNVTDSINNGGVCTVTNGTGVMVPANSSVELDYSCTYASAPTADSGTNTATATWDAASYYTPNGSASGTAGVDFSVVTPSEVNKVITVVDDKTDPLHPVTLGTSDYFTGPFEFTYSLDKQGVAGTCTDYTNTAVIDETDQSDSQTVTVCVGKNLTVTKTAAGAYNRTYHWKIDKSVDDTLIEIAEGDTATFNYTVKVTPDGYTDSGWTMGGTITVSNP
ncbi:MAG: hypothetical protein MUC85_06700, partial [Anaerolineales bacterium]|nr:hypothetical protein [Anaerolineales bacterium]